VAGKEKRGLDEMSNPSTTEIPLDTLQQTIDAVLEDPKAGATSWQVATRWTGGLRTHATIRQFSLDFDEPEPVAGGDSTASPHEIVLAAYGACLTVGYALNAARQGIDLQDMQVELEGFIDLPGFLGLEGVANLEDMPGYKLIRAKVTVKSTADRETIEELHKRVIKYSPVGLTLRMPVKMEDELVIEPGR